MEQERELGGDAVRKRVEALVQTLAALGCHSESLAAVVHDARNMVTALELYCDLLGEPGVLTPPFAHYSNELRLVVAASRRLVDKLVVLDAQAPAEPHDSGHEIDLETDRVAGFPDPALQHGLDPGFEQRLDRVTGRGPRQPDAESSVGSGPGHSRSWEPRLAEPIRDLARELLANRNLLAALAGPGIAVTVDAEGGACPVRLTAEDLTRLLVNLVKNAAEAMPAGGRIQISLRERPAVAGRLLLAVEDNGPGIPEGWLDRIFEPDFTARSRHAASKGGWPAEHRGLGLAIVRSIVEIAGGRITASNRTGTAGARFEIELPMRSF